MAVFTCAKPLQALKTVGLALFVFGVLVLAGCSSAPSKPSGSEPFPQAEPSSRLSPEQARDVTLYALGLVGTPYRYGGNTPDSGFDCSGLIGHVYKSRAEVVAPRTVSKLQNWGSPVAGDWIRSGDLVLFANKGNVSHAGIYVGEGRFVHAPSTGGEVRLDRLTSSYWAAQKAVFRRP